MECQSLFSGANKKIIISLASADLAMVEKKLKEQTKGDNAYLNKL